MAGEPASETIAWGTESWFVHVTEVPVFTVSESGLNAKFLIAMAFPPPGEAGGEGTDTGACEEEQPATMQARTTRMMHAVQNARREYAGIFLSSGAGYKIRLPVYKF